MIYWSHLSQVILLNGVTPEPYSHFHTQYNSIVLNVWIVCTHTEYTRQLWKGKFITRWCLCCMGSPGHTREAARCPHWCCRCGHCSARGGRDGRRGDVHLWLDSHSWLPGCCCLSSSWSWNISVYNFSFSISNFMNVSVDWSFRYCQFFLSRIWTCFLWLEGQTTISSY